MEHQKKVQEERAKKQEFNSQIQQLLNQVLALVEAGTYQEAITCCEKILELDPGHYQAWKVLGDVYTLLGDQQQAEAGFRKADEYF